MKEKLIKTACLALIMVGGVELLGNVAAWLAGRYLTAFASSGGLSGLGIIGGADGPTAVFVTQGDLTGWLIPLAMVVLGLLGWYGFKKCNK